jgi:hypothetical protein
MMNFDDYPKWLNNLVYFTAGITVGYIIFVYLTNNGVGIVGCGGYNG